MSPPDQLEDAERWDEDRPNARPLLALDAMHRAPAARQDEACPGSVRTDYYLAALLRNVACLGLVQRGYCLDVVHEVWERHCLIYCQDFQDPAQLAPLVLQLVQAAGPELLV